MAADASAQALLFFNADSRFHKTNYTNRVIKRQPDAVMKTPYHLAVAVLCLLILLLNTASCMQAQSLHPRHDASCGDCPKHAPAVPDVPACCSIHQQPSSAAIAIEVEQPAYLPNTFAPIASNLLAPATIPIATKLSESPPSPPLIALRI
jgi:hypothetical protein